MKTLLYTSVLIILTLGSCTSTLYTGAEYDDLYYTSSDKAVASTRAQSKDQIKGANQKPDEYYDNKYATDTLFADQYSDAVDIENQSAGAYGSESSYEYYDDYSYTDRLRRFHGNYFDPYWRDPFYLNYGYSSLGYGYGGYPGYYNPYYSPYYGDFYGGYYPSYGSYYGGYYGGYFGGLYGGYNMGFGGYYNPFYGSGYRPYYSGYSIYSEGSSVAYGRRERPSTLSSKWNGASGTGSAGRSTSLSAGDNNPATRRTTTGAVSTQAIGSDSRRQSTAIAGSREAVSPSVRSQAQDQVNSQVSQEGSVATRRAATARPEYNNSNRTYTPSYSNPRMSTRPSYNNSRVTEGVSTDVSRSNTGNVRTFSNPGTTVNPNSYQNRENVRSNSQGSSVERRVISPSGSSGSYSVPTRRSAEGGSSFSSGSSNSGGSSYSSGRSSSSYSSGSSGSSSGGSYSSGSSGGSSSGSSSSGSSSSGRR